MKMLNQVKITFASRSVNEGFARAALAAFLVQLDPTVPQLLCPRLSPTVSCTPIRRGSALSP